MMASLLVGENIWNESEDIELLPETWLRLTKAGLGSADRGEKAFFPIKLNFDEYGNCSRD